MLLGFLKRNTPNQPRKQYTNALVHTPSGRVLTFSSLAAPIVFLAEAMPDTTHVPGIGIPTGGPGIEAFISPARHLELTHWKLQTNPRQIVFKDEPASEAIVSLATLAQAKHGAITQIMRHVSEARNALRTGVDFQELTYLKKQEQAIAFRAAGFPEERATDFMFVLQYAEFASLSMRQAAEDIILKASFDDDILFKTELLRLEFFKKVREAQYPSEMESILSDFLRRCYLNSRL